MNAFGTVLALSVITQVAVERLKFPIDPKYTSKLVPLLSLLISCILTCACHIGILAILGVDISIHIVDYLLTGILISGGSTAVNDLLKVLNGLKEGLQAVKK